MLLDLNVGELFSLGGFGFGGPLHEQGLLKDRGMRWGFYHLIKLLVILY